MAIPSAHQHRIIAYHQTHRRDGELVPLASLGREAPVTHLIVSAVHIEDDGTIILNDHPHDDPHHDQLWRELVGVRQRGVKVMAMVGGWAEGTTEKLEGEGFDRYYPPLRDFLKEHHFDGIDLDVEHPMTLETAIRTIDALRADFGPDFVLAMAPVATALVGGKNLSGFDYEDLERERGDQIDFYMGQFYSGFARADDVEAYEAIIDRGLISPDRLVLGMIGAPDDASFIPLEPVAEAVADLARSYHDFGGVDIWEFPERHGEPDVVWWSQLMREAMLTGSERAVQPDPVPMLVPSPLAMRDEGVIHVAIPRRFAVRGSEDAVETVAELLHPGTGIRVHRASEGEDAFLTVTEREGDPGAYRMVTEPPGITIEPVDQEGLVNALATLRQMMPDWVHGPAPLPGADIDVVCCEIEDAPAFQWRGMHLDVARHFMPLPFLYRFVDLLALHKFNRFHLHLTEDQGWRFEVKKYPLLTTIGAGRTHTRNVFWTDDDGTPHGGYYTQDQLRALVDYAKRRGVVVVPELDLPGHMRALLAAYPQFGELPDIPPIDETRRNGGDRQNVATTWGVFQEVLHLSDDAVEMLKDILTELLDVFDSPWIHIGGDECPRTQWQASEASAQLARERGLESVDQLQPWLTEQLRVWLAERGRTMIGWDEIMDDGDVPGAVVMAWRGMAAVHRSVERGHETIVAPGYPLYFDHYQSRSSLEPYAIAGHNPWQTVARFDPFAGVPEDKRGLVMGVQGQLWTEYMRDPRHVEYMMFPRAAVLAEIAWNGAPLNPRTFAPVLRRHLQRLDAAGVNYRPLEGPHLWQQGGTGRYARPEGHR